MKTVYFCLVYLLWTLICGFLRAEVLFPADAGVIDVTQAPWNAVGDGLTDNTTGLQAMLNAHPSGNHIFYFPAGTYLISAPLVPAPSDGVSKRNIFQGESRETSILKFIDGQDISGPLIDFGAGPAQFFRNAVRDLTLDTGTGNPQAEGLRFNASNQGTVRNVTIRSGEGGMVGLNMQHSGEIGPLLVRNVRIEGFASGIISRWQTASQTYENVVLRGQTEVGFHNTNTQTVFVRGLDAELEVTAVLNNGEGRMVLMDSVLRGVEGASGQTAIRNQKDLYVLNVDTSGYGAGVSNELASFRGNVGLPAGLIREYWANGASTNRRGGAFRLFPGPDSTLRLPVEESPVLPYSPPASWSGPHLFGGVPNDGLDDTAALQAAIDSGARTIYLPRGIWRFEGTVYVRNQVERIMGTEAIIEGGGRFEIVDGTPEVVVIERLQGGSVTFAHHTERTLVLEHLLGFAYESTAESPGKLFLNDVVGHHLILRNQRVWARQLNLEGDVVANPDLSAKLLNDGAEVWILGMKTEDDGTHIKTINGGRTELFGSLHVAGTGPEPRFITVESSLTAAISRGGVTLVEETRQGETRSGEIGNADFYAAHTGEDLAPGLFVLHVGDSDRVTVEGSWSPSTGFPGGFLGESFLFASPGTGNRVTWRQPIPLAAAYRVLLRWVPDRSGQDHSGHATNALFAVEHAGGVWTGTLNQQENGSHWVALGDFAFRAGEEAVIRLSGEGANGRVLADAVRLELLSMDPPGISLEEGEMADWGLHFHAYPALMYQLWGSIDLVNWSPLRFFYRENGEVNIDLPEADGHPRYFFRLETIYPDRSPWNP